MIALKEPGLALNIPVTQAEFDDATAELVAKIGVAMEEALHVAGVTAGEIDTVVMTGGGALVPTVRQAAASRFPHARIAQTDRFGAVGLGLAVDAARRFG